MPFRAAISAASRSKIAQFTLQELALTSWACANLRFDDAPLLDAISASAIRSLAEVGDLDWGQPGQVRRGGRGMKAEVCPPDMVHCVAEAFSSIGRLQPSLLAACSDALGRLASRMDAASPARAAPLQPTDCSGPDQPAVLLEQPSVCVLMKPPQWVVTVNNQYTGMSQQAEGEAEAEGGELLLQAWVTQRLGPHFPVSADVAAQHGIVHRLDRGTSGPLLVARTYAGYFEARLQFAARRVGKEYVCICRGPLPSAPKAFHAPLKVDTRQDRQRAKVEPGVRQARTQVRRVSHVVGPRGDRTTAELYSLVEVQLHTGRRHQIRAHLSYEGHSLVGDKVYGSGAEGWCPGLFLHSHLLAFDVGDGPSVVLAQLPSVLKESLATRSAVDRRSASSLTKWLGQQG